MTAAAQVDTAEVAANIPAEIRAKLDRETNAAVFTARDLGVRRWMMNSATVSHTATSVTLTFGRGTETMAYKLGEPVIANAAAYLPWDLFETGMLHHRGRTLTLQF